MAHARPTKVDALVGCRSIGTDAAHRRFDLLGVVRGRIEGAAFPLKFPGLGGFFSLTGMVGSYAVDGGDRDRGARSRPSTLRAARIAER